MNHMIKAIFWDNDGVLVDTEILYYRACKETFASIGIDLSEDLYVEYFLKKGSGTWHLAEQKGLDDDTIIKLRQERNKIYSDLLRNHSKVITRLRRLDRHADRLALHAELLAGPPLHPHVDLARGILPHQHHGQPRRDPVGLELLDLRGQLGAHLLGNLLSVDDLSVQSRQPSFLG